MLTIVPCYQKNIYFFFFTIEQKIKIVITNCCHNYFPLHCYNIIKIMFSCGIFFVLLRLLFQIDEVRYCHIFTLNIEHYYDNIIDKVVGSYIAIWTIILNYRTVLAIALIPSPPTHLGYLLRYFDGFLRSQHVRNFFYLESEGGRG